MSGGSRDSRIATPHSFRHAMLREIYEQPQAIRETIQCNVEGDVIFPSELLLPILEVVPLQPFAYHFAVLNGCDVDHSRNLVKVVITE
jgi:glucosamine 6-phosphate synthetase-like amidotransferase/phosphosugar isomerase protein